MKEKEKENEEQEKYVNISLDKIDEFESPINIFFCSDKNLYYFHDLKSFLEKKSKKYKIKGEYNENSIVNELCYYLGIETEDHEEEIDEKETKNIIIFNVSSYVATNILESFIKKIDGNISNDDLPFFIFLKNQNNANDFELKELMSIIEKSQKDIINFSKLNSRNIFIDTENTIINTIDEIYNYYNGDYIINLNKDDEKKYNISKTINILVLGKRGCGKSTLINRILGEKKAFAHIKARTPETRDYFHRYYPIKLIDTAGFEIEGLTEKKTNEIKDINKYLEENNLAYKNIKKRVHFIFYLFRANDKLDDSVIQIFQKFQSFNIEIFFIITYSKKGEEKLHKKIVYNKSKIKRYFQKRK